MAIRLFMEQGGTIIMFPVNPEKLQVTTNGGNSTEETINLGEVTIMKTRKLRSISFSSFFPNNLAPYVLTTGDFRGPKFYIDFINGIFESKKPLRFIISDSDINILMSIDSFEYSLVGGSQDYEYTLSLSEYRVYSVREVDIPLSPPPISTNQSLASFSGTTSQPKKQSNSKRENVNDGIAIGTVCRIMGPVYSSTYGDVYRGNGGGNVFAKVILIEDGEYKYKMQNMEGTRLIGYCKRDALVVVK